MMWHDFAWGWNLGAHMLLWVLWLIGFVAIFAVICLIAGIEDEWPDLSSPDRRVHP